MSTSPHLSPAKDPSGSWREATSGVELEGGGGEEEEGKRGQKKRRRKKCRKSQKESFKEQKSFSQFITASASIRSILLISAATCTADSA